MLYHNFTGSIGMCIGELLGDTLGAHDQAFIIERCGTDLPAHAPSLHSNAEGIVWAVLTPPAVTPELLRFTICRISPCVMVMVEDQDARRQFCGLATVEEAVAFVCSLATEAMQAMPRMQRSTGSLN